jgi:aspartyl-tRNA synthetase
MDAYGTDKPDLRFGMKIVDITEHVGNSGFNIFKEVIAAGGAVKAINAKGCADFSRKKVDALIAKIKDLGGKGLASLHFFADGVKSPVAKFFPPETIQAIKKDTSAEAGDLVLMLADTPNQALAVIGALRVFLGDELNLRDPNLLGFCIIHDFPMFEWDEENKRYDPVHHMFTSPRAEDIPKLDTDPLAILSTQVDLVCNGYELCSGSVRIHKRRIQEKVMSLVGLGKEEMTAKFGHLLEALEFGAPPHGGAAPGIERLLMVLVGTDRLRDVIAFPKTQLGRDLMMDSPSPVTEEQLKELGLKLELDED